MNNSQRFVSIVGTFMVIGWVMYLAYQAIAASMFILPLLGSVLGVGAVVFVIGLMFCKLYAVWLVDSNGGSLPIKLSSLTSIRRRVSPPRE